MPASPISVAISLFFVINVLGNIPLYLALLSPYTPTKQRLILAREFGIALIILLLFNYFGGKIFELLGINQHILGMAGGILLLLISITMIFPSQEKDKGPQHEPLIVPIATPIIAGPGSIAAVMLLASRLGSPHLMAGILILTMALSCVIALLSSFLRYSLGDKGLVAFERLGGMIVALIAVQMFATGAIELVKTSFNL